MNHTESTASATTPGAPTSPGVPINPATPTIPEGRIGSIAVSSIRHSPIRELLALTVQPNILSLAGGMPAPDLLPNTRVAQAAQTALADPDALQYGETTGLPALKDIVASRDSASLGRLVAPNEVVITHGSQQALSLLGLALLNPGDDVVVENPAYIGALQVFESYRANLHAIGLDADGMKVDDLAAALRGGLRPKIVHTVSNFHNPRGVSLSLPRRRQLAALAETYGFWVIEDDPYGELRFRGETVPSVAAFSSRVFRLGSTSKTLGPGLRTGWFSGPREVVELVELLKQGADLCGSNLTHLIAAELLADQPFLDSHLALLRGTYATNAAALETALIETFGDRAEISTPEGGMFVWMGFTDGTDTTVSIERALAAGVAFIPGAAFAARPEDVAPLRGTARMCFTTCTPDELREAVARMATVL